MITRPTTQEIYRYRASVDQRVLELIGSYPESQLNELAWLLRIGMHHEQQHQELFYTEIKYILAENPLPLRTPYQSPEDAHREPAEAAAPPARIVPFQGGLFEFGNLEGGWCWDNELPVHKHYLHDFALSSRLVTNGEFIEFIEDGGYENQLLWLDNGWSWKCRAGCNKPLYWEYGDGQWLEWTLRGMRELRMDEPVCHVGFYEADAFAQWKAETYGEHRNARLPGEREWEYAVRQLRVDPDSQNLLARGSLHPEPAHAEAKVAQLFGDVWEWTASYYEPYPGYQPFAGNLTEYNAKFMDNQRILRGGSCVTPTGHIRPSYRNFWSADTRFQFSGFRLAYPANA